MQGIARHGPASVTQATECRQLTGVSGKVL